MLHPSEAEEGDEQQQDMVECRRLATVLQGGWSPAEMESCTIRTRERESGRASAERNDGRCLRGRLRSRHAVRSKGGESRCNRCVHKSLFTSEAKGCIRGPGQRGRSDLAPRAAEDGRRALLDFSPRPLCTEKFGRACLRGLHWSSACYRSPPRGGRDALVKAGEAEEQQRGREALASVRVNRETH